MKRVLILARGPDTAGTGMALKSAFDHHGAGEVDVARVHSHVALDVQDRDDIQMPAVEDGLSVDTGDDPLGSSFRRRLDVRAVDDSKILRRNCRDGGAEDVEIVDDH